MSKQQTSTILDEIMKRNFEARPEAEKRHYLLAALKEMCSPAEYQAIIDRATLLNELQAADAATGITWPEDTGGLQ
jgi:hypothetical protein